MAKREASPASPTPARPGRPRVADLDDRVESAVLALLHEGGPSAVTMEGVAARSGVAKTSVYRRHANRTELLSAVLHKAVGTPEVPREGTVREKIRFALEQAWRQMGDVLGPGGLAAVVAGTDPEFTELCREALRPYDESLVRRIRSDSRAGRLARRLDADGVATLMFGAYLGELVRNDEVSSDWLDRCMELLWVVMAPSSSSS